MNGGNTMDDVSGIIRDQADRLFRDLVSSETLANCGGDTWPSALWNSVQDSGLPLALASEDCGGIGLAMSAVGTLCALTGYHTVPLPLAETMLAYGLWASATGSVPTGPASLAPDGDVRITAIEPGNSGYRLQGSVKRVPWGTHVEDILLFAHDGAGGRHLVLLPRFLTWSSASTNLAGEPRADIILTGIVVPADRVSPAPREMTDGLQPYGALIRAFQMVGAMRRALDLSLQYAGDRVQFGRPIAKFQAIQQMLAEAAGHIAAAEAACGHAAMEMTGPNGLFFTAAAKARTGEAAGKVAEICHQAHGAIGFTQEHSLHFATRRLWSWRDEFGNESYWQEIIGRTVCAAGAPGLWPCLNPLS